MAASLNSVHEEYVAKFGKTVDATKFTNCVNINHQGNGKYKDVKNLLQSKEKDAFPNENSNNNTAKSDDTSGVASLAGKSETKHNEVNDADDVKEPSTTDSSSTIETLLIETNRNLDKLLFFLQADNGSITQLIGKLQLNTLQRFLPTLNQLQLDTVNDSKVKPFNAPGDKPGEHTETTQPNCIVDETKDAESVNINNSIYALQAEHKDNVSASVVTDATGIGAIFDGGVSSIEPAFTMNDPLIVIAGVGEYDGLPNLDGVSKDYDNIINTFVNHWKYKVFYQLNDNTIIYSNDKNEIQRNYKLKWNDDEIECFVEKVRKCIVNNRHNGLIFGISSHGDRDKIMYDSECESVNLDAIFSMFSPEANCLLSTYEETEEETDHLFAIPKIFFLDMCRGNLKPKLAKLDGGQHDTSGGSASSFSAYTTNDAKAVPKHSPDTNGWELDCIVSDQLSSWQNDGADVENEFELQQLMMAIEQSTQVKNEDTNSANTKDDMAKEEKENPTEDKDAIVATGLSLHNNNQDCDIDGSEEAFKFKSLTKEEAQTMIAQMANFSKVYANVEGCSVADGSQNGGIFLRSVCKLFNDTQFILKHGWTDIIFKLREYTKRDASLVNNLFNFTQLVEDEGTLEKQVRFASRYLNLVPLDEIAEDDDELESNKLIITNVSPYKLAVLVEMEENLETRYTRLGKLSRCDEKEFEKNKFTIIDAWATIDSKEIFREFFYITLFRLGRYTGKVFNYQMCEKKKFSSKELYYVNDKLIDIDDALPKCRVLVNEKHVLSQGAYKATDKCAICQKQIGAPNMRESYRCPTCKYSVCKNCCKLVISRKIPWELNVPVNIETHRQISQTSVVLYCQQQCASFQQSEPTHIRIRSDPMDSKENEKEIKYQVECTIIGNGSGNVTKQEFVFNPFADKFEITLNLPDNLECKQDTIALECQIRMNHNKFDIGSFSSQPYVMEVRIGALWRSYKCLFTTLDGKGRFGPTNTDGYKNEMHYNDTKMDVKQKGMQLWTVPATGEWRIICYGAKGGDSKFTMKGNNNSQVLSVLSVLSGGAGSAVGGIIRLYKNDVIKIAVGQMGATSDKNEHIGGGGGGATYFVLYKIGNNNPKYKKDENNIANMPLIIASGGHGACNPSDYLENGINGLCETSANRMKYGGYNSNGRAGRGASFNNIDSLNFSCCVDDVNNKQDYDKCNGQSFLDGAIGGEGYNEQSCDGGFGGGGGSFCEGGAGGGYIGGLVSQQDPFQEHSNKYSLYGALSYSLCQDTAQKVMKSGCNKGNGKIEAYFQIDNV